MDGAVTKCHQKTGIGICAQKSHATMKELTSSSRSTMAATDPSLPAQGISLAKPTVRVQDSERQSRMQPVMMKI